MVLKKGSLWRGEHTMKQLAMKRKEREKVSDLLFLGTRTLVVGDLYAGER